MIRHGISGGAAVMLVLGAMALGPVPARGAPLDPSACGELQTRLDALRQDGVEADMAMGPEAARTRLPIERFNRIGTYIEIEEQLNFRCGLGKQKIVLPTTVEGGEEEIPAPGEAAATGTGTPPGPAATPKAPAAIKGVAVGKEAAPAGGKEKATPRTKSPAAAKPPQAAKGKDTTGAPAKAPKKKAPAKKKPAAEVDDAYRPPPPWRTVVREADEAAAD